MSARSEISKYYLRNAGEQTKRSEKVNGLVTLAWFRRCRDYYKSLRKLREEHSFYTCTDKEEEEEESSSWRWEETPRSSHLLLLLASSLCCQVLQVSCCCLGTASQHSCIYISSSQTYNHSEKPIPILAKWLRPSKRAKGEVEFKNQLN